MPVFSTIISLKNYLYPHIQAKEKIGFVPTMGALHQGHLSLMKFSLSENDVTVVSIFVNPTQFNNKFDLQKYPRNVEKDNELIQSLDKNIVVFAPSVEEMYEQEAVAKEYHFDGIEFEMEGLHRPGHFNGVGTIVEKLFKIVEPRNAYFGEKDFQQLQIIKKLVKNYNLPVNVIGCPILREPNGLAMSSRNERLSKEARSEAKIIYQILQKSVEVFKEKSAKKTINFVENEFKKHPRFELEYYEIASEDTLKSCVEKREDEMYRGFVAVFIEDIRLIDNIPLV